MNTNKTSDHLIFIPTYNERLNIEILLNELNLLQRNFDYLIIDDSSPDKTFEFLHNKYNNHKNFNLIKRKNKQGIGSAHIQAIKYAKKNSYKYLITMDADLTHKPSDIIFFLKKICSFDLVIGSRFSLHNSLEDWNFFRKIITNFGHLVTKNLLNIPFDATSGFRMYNLNKFKYDDIKLIKSKNYDFFYESILIFYLKNYKITEVGIKLPKRTYGNSKMSFYQLINSVLKILYLFIKIKFNSY